MTLADIAVANRLAHEVLGRSLDELPPQTRRVLHLIETLVNEKTRTLEILRTDFRFSRRAVREASGIGDTQLRIHLARLVELEYLLVHRDSRGQSFVYELLYDGQGKDGTPFVPGLIDSDTLHTTLTTSTSRGQSPPFAGLSRGQRGPNAAASRATLTPEDARVDWASDDVTTPLAKPHGSQPNATTLSYPQPMPFAAARR